jgi:hypothetical protein
VKLTVALVVLGVALLALPLAVKRLQDRPQYIKVRIVDRFTATVHRDSFPDADFLNGLLLAAGCGLATMAALFVWGGVLGGGELRRFFLVSAIGLGALAVEETFELSETVAYRAGVDASRTDLIFPLIAAVFLLAYRRILRTSRRAMLIGGIGAAVFVIAVFLDDVFPSAAARAEDPLESVATLFLLTAFGILTLELLGKRPRELAA